MKIIVVGGGAAGMMAAIAASDAGAEVTLLEKNEKLGKKIYITGKGRCNVTNNCDPENFFDNVISNKKFMFSSYYCFDNNMVMDIIEKAGCELKTERGNRVFPVSDHSSDIISAFSRMLKQRGVKVCLNTEVISIDVTDGCASGVSVKNAKSVDHLVADKVIVATGGVSYSTTGSTGDGIKWAEDAGHRIVECRPALVPFTVKEEYVKDLQGLSLKNVGFKICDGKKTVYEDFGEMLFTHFGVSGPLVLSGSSYYASYVAKHPEAKNNITAYIDLKSTLSVEQLDKRIIRDFEKYTNKQFKNSLDDLLPSKMIPVIVKMSGIDESKPVNLITREERQKIVELLKNLKISITGTRGFNEAIITQGGVSVKDIDPSTMESKIVKNLYFCGEVIDVDALTGGYNLQVAWSTGHLAGDSAANS